ncbi:MAG TPA: hypothetical protein VK586_02525 [Streptosporangiaceae bacterium]|nr:hypothetical protein [Streptosporangiaceae bacterium]
MTGKGVLRYEILLGEGEPAAGASAVLTEADAPGSISNNPAGRREMIIFRCCGPYSLIERAGGSGDIDAGPARLVRIDPPGTELIAALHPGDVKEMTIRSDGGHAYTARWTHQETP